jgi:hypothetical protein
MQELLDLLTLLAALAAASIPFWGKYFSSYGQQKGKNLADKEDVQRLTELVESVKSEFAREIEGVKRQQAVALDSDKVSVTAARELLRSIYRLRDAIRVFRSPMVWSYEFPNEAAKANVSGGDKWRHVYANRWKPLSESITQWESACLEAEVLFGGHSNDLKRQCDSHLRSLNAATRAIIDDADMPSANSQEHSAFIRSMRAIVSGIGEDNDKYWSEWLKTVSAVETFVREILSKHLPQTK